MSAKRGRPVENIKVKIKRLEREIGACLASGDAAGAAALRKFAAANSIAIKETAVEFYATQQPFKFEEDK